MQIPCHFIWEISSFMGLGICELVGWPFFFFLKPVFYRYWVMILYMPHVCSIITCTYEFTVPECSVFEKCITECGTLVYIVMVASVLFPCSQAWDLIGGVLLSSVTAVMMSVPFANNPFPPRCRSFCSASQRPCTCSFSGMLCSPIYFNIKIVSNSFQLWI